MDNENKVSKQEIAERKKRDAEVTLINDEAYKDKNVKDISTFRDKFKDAKGNMKEKEVESVLYQNGVRKNSLIAVYKNNRLLYKVASRKDKMASKKKGKR